MTAIRALRWLIREQVKQSIQAAAEAPEGSLLGRIAFAASRSDVPYEENTREEERIQRDLEDYVAGNTQIPVSTIDRIKELMSAGLYSKTLLRPSATKLFRGMALEEHQLRQMLGLKPDDFLDSEGYEDLYGKTIGPKSGTVTSWTSNYSEAWKFASGETDYGDYFKDKEMWKVVLVASAAENVGSFLELSNVYKISSITQYESEQEVIGLGDVKIYQIRWNMPRP